jgi:hypothetical protein
MEKNNNKSRGIQVLVVIALVVLIVYALLATTEDRSLNRVDTTDWFVYKNEIYQFEIMYPPDWIVGEFVEDEMIPRVNIYPPNQQFEHPLTHHSFASHVSIFPAGIPTEGVFGETRASSVPFSPEVRGAVDYILDDGTVFATFVAFDDRPASWTESGFVWANVEIDGFGIRCYRQEEEVSLEACDPMEGDLVVREGSVDPNERSYQEAMLSSFEYSR